ncbi:MAG: hypothetical protein M1832_000646 [Thelocarpon impressellum]|nr:MAG: hypothetical protein M1832_000646 [Thelocarpon impressellum]
MASPSIPRAVSLVFRQLGRSRTSFMPCIVQRCASTKLPKGFIPPTSDDLTELRERVQEFTRREIREELALRTDQSNEFPSEMWGKLGQAGFLGITAEEDYGGLAMGYQAHCIVMEEISRASGSIGLSYAAHSQLCINQLSLNGTRAQKERLLPGLISGERVGALAMSEHSAGSDVVSMKSTAKAVDGGWVLNGTKMWITNGPDADYIVTYAKTEPQRAAKGITAFIIEKKFEGFSCTRKLDKLGMRGSNTGELVFDNVFVPADNVLGEVNGGVKVLMEGLDIERLVLSAGPLGIMQAAMDLVLPYTHTRRQFDTPIAHNQFIQGKLADMYTKLQASRSYTYATAKRIDEEGSIRTLDCAGAILYAAERATECGLDAIQLLGGNGYVNEIPAGRLLRDAKLYEIGAGTSEIRRIVIGRAFNKQRVARTASQSGIRTTTVYTDPDVLSQHALASPYAVNLGLPTAYLDGDRIIEVAKQQGCQSIHPGYGFLSENASFARKCTEAGLIFVGPPWKAIEAMGSKSESKTIMTAAGVPCIPGYHGKDQDPDRLRQEAEKIGYPVLLKAVKGGGGKGMRIVQNPDAFDGQLRSAQSEARNSFGDDVMLVEKYITRPRHVEVQVFADKHGNCVALGERDCSIQRRHQKILEESPAPHLAQDIRQDLWAKARAAALAVGYEGAGTVEFIFDKDTQEFFFMEMNTRLQVEHPVTEMVTGEDLVHWQFLVAEGGKLPLSQEEIEARISERGWAAEARIYAENPHMNFIPDAGRLVHLKTPQTSDSVRVDAGFVAGDEVSSHYDPMIAKLIVGAPTRHEALRKLKLALDDYEVVGVTTNIDFIKRLCENADFMAGEVETGFIDKHRESLFARERTDDEAFAQAALGLLLQDTAPHSSGAVAGFGGGHQHRRVSLIEVLPGNAADGPEIPVMISQTGPETYDISVNDSQYTNVRSQLNRESNVVTSFFPHTRIATTLVRSGDSLSTFQRGKHNKFSCAPPAWFEKALGIKATSNSVLAPMPCKILRVEVAEGDQVRKDQALVVIESMKMETVIRSPQDGVVSRIMHQQGDLCKAGTALVEFDGGER